MEPRGTNQSGRIIVMPSVRRSCADLEPGQTIGGARDDGDGDRSVAAQPERAGATAALPTAGAKRSPATKE